MTNSQMKKAIDETISNEPMMNEAFVQRVLNGKKKRKKPIPFMQPALVVVMMLVIGAMLYFTPSQTEQMAVETKEYYQAKPEHLQNMLLQNRYNDQITYFFSNGTLYYHSDTRFFYEKPEIEDEKPAPRELVEKTYTNIKIKTKGNQYFITGDDGFSLTLTRTAPRILQDEKGIEYTTPMKFEDLDKISDGLIDEEIKALKLYQMGGTGTNAYTMEEDLAEVNDWFKQATINHNINTFDFAKYNIEVEYISGEKRSFNLFLSDNGQPSAMSKIELFSSMQGLFEIPEELANHFRQLVKQIEEIDNSK